MVWHSIRVRTVWYHLVVVLRTHIQVAETLDQLASLLSGSPFDGLVFDRPPLQKPSSPYGNTYLPTRVRTYTYTTCVLEYHAMAIPMVWLAMP